MPHIHEPKDRNIGQWIEANDRIRLAAYSSASSLVVLFSGYFRKANGEVIQIQEEVRPTSDRALTEKSVHYGAGFLLSLVAYLGTGNANRGQCYVTARVQRSTGTPTVVLAELIGGYVTDDTRPSFPYGKVEGPLDGAGYIRIETPNDPADNGSLQISVPTGARCALIFANGLFTASADAANRLPFFTYDNGSGIGGVYFSNTYVTANGVRQVVASPGGAHVIHTTYQGENLPVPKQQFPATWLFSLRASSAHANDRWSFGQFGVEEWIEV